ncbi:hypothetical protein [Brevinema andersonii]|nr:hypothetical protein [Brevinema andersonii]
MVTHTKPSLLIQGKSITANRKTLYHLPSHVTEVFSEDELFREIQKITETNPDATFTFYVNDLRNHRIEYFLMNNGIDQSRFQGVLITDGTASYTRFDQRYNKETGGTQWNNDLQLVKSLVAKPYTIEKKDYNAFCVPPYLYSNYVFWLAWPELVDTIVPEIASDFQKNPEARARYYKIDLYAYAQSLLPVYKNTYVKMFGLDKKWQLSDQTTLDNKTIEEVFNQSPKKKIIILGSHRIENYEQRRNDYIKKTQQKYGKEYDYFYKPHPASPIQDVPSDIDVLPHLIPTEIIYTLYADNIEYIGGFQSSVFMNLPQMTKKFFYMASSGNDLITPIDKMYDLGLLGQVDFFSQ